MMMILIGAALLAGGAAIERRKQAAAVAEARPPLETMPGGYYVNPATDLGNAFARPQRFALPDIQWQAGAVGRVALPRVQNADALYS
jgi:hypothetical protein